MWTGSFLQCLQPCSGYRLRQEVSVRRPVGVCRLKQEDSVPLESRRAVSCERGHQSGSEMCQMSRREATEQLQGGRWSKVERRENKLEAWPRSGMESNKGVWESYNQTWRTHCQGGRSPFPGRQFFSLLLFRCLFLPLAVQRQVPRAPCHFLTGELEPCKVQHVPPGLLGPWISVIAFAGLLSGWAGKSCRLPKGVSAAPKHKRIVYSADMQPGHVPLGSFSLFCWDDPVRKARTAWSTSTTSSFRYVPTKGPIQPSASKLHPSPWSFHFHREFHSRRVLC